MNCVKGEIHNVLSMMRANARWASADRFRQEIPASTQSPLMRAFKQLHYELQSVTDLSDVDTVTYLLPFLLVIESDKTSGFITGAAIASLNKFLLYRLITSESLRADVAINRIAVCVSRCRFEETDRTDDEHVLVKLLELVEYSLRSDAGHLITGENVWNMVQLCYRISCQPRSSLHLRRAAENTLAHLILTVFDRINELESPRVTQAHQDSDELDDEERAAADEIEDLSTQNRQGAYGIPLLERILQFLSSLVSPASNDEATCVLGLRLINIVLETAGTGLSNHPSLVSVLQGDLSKYLLQNSETEELAILSLVLRVVFNLFNSIKDHLKVQLEVFFTSVHMRIIDSPSCSDEQKELALESLLEFCREPALMLDLFINYDCDVHCTNLFEVLCKSLSRNCQAMASENGGLNALSLLCMEGLLAVIESIARRCPLSTVKSSRTPGGNDGTAPQDVRALRGSDLAQFTSAKGVPTSSSDLPLDAISPMSSVQDLMQLVMSNSDSESDTDQSDFNGDQLAWLHTARERTAEVLQQRKRAKKRYALAAEKFNTDQKNWIAYSQQIGLLPEKITPEAVASFLLHTPGLNKTLIGDYLGDGPEDKYPFNAAVRESYVAMFDFRNAKSLDEALRLFLAKFRLPGEAQKIDRMMEAFSKHFFEQCSTSGPLADADAAYVLSFSIIMLNTDLHSDQISKKMTLDEFVRNNRGINAGQDLPREYLARLYHNIQQNQIQMQHDVSDLMESNFAGVDRYSTQWDGVLKRSENVVGASFTSNSSILKLRAGLYEKEMFNLISEFTIKSILLSFEKTCDVTNMERALDGLSNCAKITLYYEMYDDFNKIMGSMASYFLTFSHGILNGEKVFMPPSSSIIMRQRSVSASSTTSQSSATSGRRRQPSYSHIEEDSVEDDGEHEREPEPTGPLSSMDDDHIRGARTRRALISLKVLFQFVQNRQEYFRKAWSSVVECILMFNELDVVPTSLVEMDDFVDSRGVPLPPIQGSTASNSAAHHSSSNAQATGVSGKTRERSRRLAERQAAIRSRMKSMGHGTYGSYSNTSSGSIWESLSSYLWAEEEKVDENFSMVTNVLREAVAKLGGGMLEKENWLRMVRKMEEKSLVSLLETLLSCRDPFKCIMRPSDGGVDAMMQENAILVLELSIDLILVNAHRICSLSLWDPFHQYAKRILSTPLNELEMQLLVERVVVHILRVSIRLFHDEKIRPRLMETLQLLLDMGEDMYRALNDRLACGINMLLKANLVYMHDFHEWTVLLGILEAVVQHKNGRAACWESVKLLAEGGYLNSENVTLWIAICLRFISYRTAYSVDALRLLQGLTHGESPYRFDDDNVWLEIMRVMLNYLNDDRPPIAKTAWECLYKSLLLPGVPISKDTWRGCFEQIIFTFDDQVNEGVWRNSRDASVYSITLLSKTFLHNVDVLVQLPTFQELWLNVLRRLATKLATAASIANSSQGAASNAVMVYEMTLQSLYNLLVVLKAERILEKTSDFTAPQTLYDDSCRVIDEVCPHLKEQLGLIPEEPVASEPVPTNAEHAASHDAAVEDLAPTPDTMSAPPPVPASVPAPAMATDEVGNGDEHQPPTSDVETRDTSIEVGDSTPSLGSSSSVSIHNSAILDEVTEAV